MSTHFQERFYFTTLDCKLNFAESAALIKRFSDLGFIQSQCVDEADWVIVHSYAVTSVAEKKTRHTITKLLKESPKAKFIIIGCMADINSEPLHKLLKNNEYYIVDHSQKMNIANILTGENTLHKTINTFKGAYSLDQRTRSFLKIQDGCDYFCSYCTVPYARGRSVSNTIKGVLSDIESIIDKGFKEIILTGVNIGTFGLNNNESFYQLLENIDKRNYDVRIRLGSTEPELLSNEIISLVSKSKIIMPHFHLPLQSGCDKTLQRMRRRYNVNLFAQKVGLIIQLIPHACIAADVIVGFPGETEEDFQQSYNFIKSIPISYLHIFPYSNRPLAHASKYPDQINPAEIKKRANELSVLAKEKQKIFFTENIGTVRPVLFESYCDKDLIFGFTDNYIKCGINDLSISENQLLSLRLDKIESNNLYVFVKNLSQ